MMIMLFVVIAIVYAITAGNYSLMVFSQECGLLFDVLLLLFCFVFPFSFLVFVLCLVPSVTMSLDGLFCIAPSNFSNVYFLLNTF